MITSLFCLRNEKGNENQFFERAHKHTQREIRITLVMILHYIRIYSYEKQEYSLQKKKFF